MRDHAFALDVARRLECGLRLLQQAQAGRDVGLVERDDVDRVPRAVKVAGAPRQCQRLPRGGIGLGDAALIAARTSQRPQRPPLADGLTQRLEQPGSLRGRLRSLLVVQQTKLRLRQSVQAGGLQRRLFALARRLQSFFRGDRRGPRIACAKFDNGPAIQRLRHEGGFARAAGEFEHCLRVRRCRTGIALGNEAFGAQVQKVDAAADVQAAPG